MDYKVYKKTFGNVLQTIRLKKGLSQERLALDCGLDRTFISMLERGLRQPSLTTIVKISDTLQIKPSKLLLDTEKSISKSIKR
jgi:transcriptional regulator with XRE-family HTH domain